MSAPCVGRSSNATCSCRYSSNERSLSTSSVKMGVSINLTLIDYVIGGEPATPPSIRLTPERTASGPPVAFHIHSLTSQGRDAVTRQVRLICTVKVLPHFSLSLVLFHSLLLTLSAFVSSWSPLALFLLHRLSFSTLVPSFKLLALLPLLRPPLRALVLSLSVYSSSSTYPRLLKVRFRPVPPTHWHQSSPHKGKYQKPQGHNCINHGVVMKRSNAVL